MDRPEGMAPERQDTRGARRILVALDGSPQSERALPWAESFARATGSEVLLARVTMAPRAGLLMAPIEVDLDAENEMKATAKAYLEEIASRLRERGVSVSTKTRHHEKSWDTVQEARRIMAEEVADTLCDIAEEVNADFVVLSSHGATSSRMTSWGSVAEAVLKRMCRPVFIVPVHYEGCPLPEVSG